MNNSFVLQNLVLLGGGHAHVHVIKMLGMHPLPGIQVIVITRDVQTPYSGMLPGYVAGKYTKDECHVDLSLICNWAKMILINAEATHIDTINKKIYLKNINNNNDRPPISYDILSIDIGITPSPQPYYYCKLENKKLNTENMINDINLIHNITGVKPIDKFAKKFDNILYRISTLSNQSINSNKINEFKLVVVGGGAGGCELSLAVHDRIQQYLHKNFNVNIILVSKSINLLSGLSNKRVAKIIHRILLEKNIIIYTNTEIIGATKKLVNNNNEIYYLIDQNFNEIEYNETIWCTQGSGAKWLSKTNLALTNVIVSSDLKIVNDNDNNNNNNNEFEKLEGGFICVNSTLESINIPGIFACGDCCHMVDNPRPKAGVFAVRAGPPLLNNLKRKLLNQPLEKWIPQTDFLGIIFTGNDYAVASRGALAVEGKYLWDLKHNIDKNWMAMYQILPIMDENSNNNNNNNIPEIAHVIGKKALDLLSKRTMRCGGCGSKVGSQILSRSINAIKNLIPINEYVVAGIGDDAALIKLPSNINYNNDYLVHTVDYVKSFISDPYIFGQITALHSLSDIHAMNGIAISALAICVIPYGPEEMIEDNLIQILAGACNIFKEDKDNEIDIEYINKYQLINTNNNNNIKYSPGCALVGGHTSEGMELSLGFAINGIVSSNCVLNKGSPKLPRYLNNTSILTYDVIVLTKPLGTGTILAANMRGLVKSEWMNTCTLNMLLSNKLAARIISSASYDNNNNNNYICCTDVTGFGLLGHLIEMLKYNDNNNNTENNNNELPAAILNVSKIPLLPGSLECIHAGIFSTLHPQNLRCKHAVLDCTHDKNIIKKLEYPLLFDPQTSGGLLATLPIHHADRVIHELHSYGYKDSTIIGRIIKRDNNNNKDIMIHLED